MNLVLPSAWLVNFEHQNFAELPKKDIFYNQETQCKTIPYQETQLAMLFNDNNTTLHEKNADSTPKIWLKLYHSMFVILIYWFDNVFRIKTKYQRLCCFLGFFNIENTRCPFPEFDLFCI